MEVKLSELEYVWTMFFILPLNLMIWLSIECYIENIFLNGLGKQSFIVF